MNIYEKTGYDLINYDYLYGQNQNDLNNERKKIENILDNIQYILNNYDNLLGIDFYNHFRPFIKIENSKISDDEYSIFKTNDDDSVEDDYSIDGYIIEDDYDDQCIEIKIDNENIKIANLMYNTNHKEIIRIKTNMVYESIKKERHGKDLSWRTDYYQIYLDVATSKGLDKEKVYSVEEIKNMIVSNDILIVGTKSAIINNINNINFEKEEEIEINNNKEMVMSYENALGIILKSKYPKRKLFDYFKRYLMEIKEYLTILKEKNKNFYIDDIGYIDNEIYFKETGYSKIYELYNNRFKNKRNWE